LSRLLLGLVLLSLPGLALTVTESMVTKAVNTSACTVPVPATTFLTTDQAVWLWFNVTGANAGDVASVTWYSPNGTAYDSGSWSPVPSAGGWCYSWYIAVADSPPASSPGNWSVQVAWNGSPLFTLPFSIVASAVPSINTGGITNAASSSQGPFAAGSHLTIKGANLANATTGVTTAPLPTTLNGAKVSIGGVTAPLLYVSPTQINLQVPWELSGQTQASVSVNVNGTASAPQTMSLAPYGPGIYSMNGSGTGQGAVQIANTTLFVAPAGAYPNPGSRPVQPGEYISIYATGLGAVTNQPASGAFALADPLSWTTLMPTVTLGGVPAQVTFSGLGPAPGNPGLYQVNALVPANAPSGDAVPLSLSIGNAVSNTVTIAVAGTAPVFTLSVTKTGTGTGTVTSSPAGITCGATCSASYASGAQVTLTATADPGSTFTGWSGACSGTGTCAVTMNAAATVTASFNTASQGAIAISSLSGNSVPPFGTLVINGSGFDPANAAISVLLTPTAGGPSIAVPAAAATANSIQITVPPLLGATKGLATGAASVQVIQLEGTTLSTSNVVTGLQITALPAVPADAVPGEVTLAFLDETLNVDAAAIAAAQTDPDLTDLAAALGAFDDGVNTLASAIQAIMNAPSQPITVTGADGVQITLDANTLALSDQLIWAYVSQFLIQVVNQQQPSSAAGRSAAAGGMLLTPADTPSNCSDLPETSPEINAVACQSQQGYTTNMPVVNAGAAKVEQLGSWTIAGGLSALGGWVAAAYFEGAVAVLAFQVAWDYATARASALALGTQQPSTKDSLKDASTTVVDKIALQGKGILPLTLAVLSLIPKGWNPFSSSSGSPPQGGLILTGPQTGVPNGSSGVQAFQTSNGQTTVTTLAAPASQQVNPMSSVTIPPPASCTNNQVNAWNNMCMAIYNYQSGLCSAEPTLIGELGCINAAVGAWEQCFDACQP
jgi:uncharacterized protein (TIGR03437 family)